jgi:hypothetical protein
VKTGLRDDCVTFDISTRFRVIFLSQSKPLNKHPMFDSRFLTHPVYCGLSS